MEMVEDAQKVSNILRTTVGQWSESVVRSKDRWYSQFFSKGAISAGHQIFNNTIQGVVTDTSGNLIYDSVSFFNSAHVNKAGTSYSNTAGSTSLTHTNLKTYYTTYTDTNAKDERGNEIENVPDVLVIKPDELFNARVILANTAIPGSADNDLNVLAAIVDLMVWPRISGSNIWILGKRKAGLMGTDRKDVELNFYQEEETLDYFTSINLRWGGCVTDEVKFSPLLEVIPVVKSGELLGSLNSKAEDNQQPRLLNGWSVGSKVQRLGDEEALTNNSPTSARNPYCWRANFK